MSADVRNQIRKREPQVTPLVSIVVCDLDF
jgi:hypothetical protein